MTRDYQFYYRRYRGKCKETCEKWKKRYPQLTIKTGWYEDAFMGDQEHWWLEDEMGRIIDPTKKQFLYQFGSYREFTGTYACLECGNEFEATSEQAKRNYGCCSTDCLSRMVGIHIY